MVAVDHVLRMREAMRKCLADPVIMAERRSMEKPVKMGVLFHDGPGIQFFDAKGSPLLHDFVRDEETAIQLWNALTDGAPIDQNWFK